MIIKFSDYLSVDDGIDLSKSFLQDPVFFPSDNSYNYGQLPEINIRLLPLEVEKKVFLHGKEYNVISLSDFFRQKGADGKYHAIYIWIDYNSGEYYVGKVNREKWSEIRRYTGSGVRFKPKYKKHIDRYVRYYICVCDSEKETEDVESEIVNDDLLNDPFCLNIIKGGGGISNMPYSEKRKEKQRQYMKEHPERYEAMLKAAHNFDEEQIRERNKKIKETMSSEYHKNLSRERMLKFRKENPGAYEAAREKNRQVLNSPEVKRKRSQSLKKYKENNPEQAKTWKEHIKLALSNPEVRAKMKNSQKEWIRNNPEAAAERLSKARRSISNKRSKSVNMIDLKTGAIVKSFNSIKEAAAWLIDSKITASVNPSSQIAATCKKKQIPGHGTKKTAYGYRWEYSKNQK